MKPSINSFKVDLEDLPLSDEAKHRITTEFRASVLRELASYDDGYSEVFVRHLKNGGMVIRDTAAVANMNVAELMKLTH